MKKRSPKKPSLDFARQNEDTIMMVSAMSLIVLVTTGALVVTMVLTLFFTAVVASAAH